MTPIINIRSEGDIEHALNELVAGRSIHVDGNKEMREILEYSIMALVIEKHKRDRKQEPVDGYGR